MEGYEALVKQARKKDSGAFAQLYEMVYEDMYRMAYYMLGNAQDAQDAVSDAVLAAFEGIAGLKNAKAFRGWIFRILIHTCRRRRGSYVRAQLPLEEQESAAWQDGPDAEKLDVRRAFLQLPQEERTILSMAVFGGYTSKEIGHLLHKNANTVRTSKRRALEKLQRALTDAGKGCGA